MKLSNQQINALANKIYKDIVTPVKEYNEVIENSNEYKNFIKEDKDCRKLQEISDKYPSEEEKYRSGVSDYIDLAQVKIKNLYFKNKFKKTPDISIDTIEQEIILGTIDCEGLDQLIEKVKNKFLK